MKKICIVTATRAEYSFLKPLIFELKKLDDIQTQLLVTGTHVEKRYGYTLDEILNDGLSPDACINIIEDDTQLGILSTMANATRDVGKAIEKLAPDMVVLLGDRYETFSIASACVILGIPICHISGGDVTYGAYDDMFRHAITKMSNLHFTSCKEYRNRVIQLGEHPDTVFNVGSLSIENIKQLKLLSVSEINKRLGIDVKNTILGTFHPVTMENTTQKEQLKELLEALIEQKKYNILFTKANADTGASELNEMLIFYSMQHPNKFKVVESLGVLQYLSVMKNCACVIGNSSSGILEAPSFQVPTINIGNRQKGRVQAQSIINCEAKKEKILNSLNKLETAEFKQILKNTKNPYEGVDTAKDMAAEIKNFVNKLNRFKIFYSVEVK